MIKRAFVLAVVAAAALGCASGSGPTTEEPQDTGFGNEGGADPGMGTGNTATRAVEPSSNELMSVYFEFDDHSLRADARAALKHNADVLSRNPDMKVTIQGHCDERGSEEYNLALGQRRADSARRYLVDLGVSGARMTTVSFGEERPAVRGHNETAWAKNRRDDFVPR